MIDSHGRALFRPAAGPAPGVPPGPEEWRPVQFLTDPTDTSGSLPGTWAALVRHQHGQRLTPVTMDDVRRRLFRLMADTAPALDWLLLTKRPENLFRWWRELTNEYAEQLRLAAGDERTVSRYRKTTGRDYARAVGFHAATGLMANVWVGVTAESQADALRRMPYLCNIPAVRRFVSCEPLVGPVVLRGDVPDPGRAGHTLSVNYLSRPPVWSGDFTAGASLFDGEVEGVHWVITGGESGADARVHHPDWFRSLRDQAEAADTPFHFKQHGEWLDIGHATPNANGSPTGWAFPDKSRPLTEEVRAETRAGRLPLPMTAFRVGRKEAGRELDGRTHDGVPPSVL